MVLTNGLSIRQLTFHLHEHIVKLSVGLYVTVECVSDNCSPSFSLHVLIG